MDDSDRHRQRLDATLKLRLTAEMRARLRERAFAERRSEGAVGRLAIEQYLDEVEPDARAA